MADIALRLGKDVLVVQGAVGTALIAQGFPADMPLPLLNLTEPESVLELERTYRAVGADCGVTNTFMATSSRLAAHGLEGQVGPINVAGVQLVREAGFPHVLASVGPCGIEVEEGSGTSLFASEGAEDAAAAQDGEPDASAQAVPQAQRAWQPLFGAAVEQYAEQIAALASADPDALLLETFTSVDDVLAAVVAAKRTCELPIIASMVFAPGASEDEIARAARALAASGVAALGCNCMDIAATVRAVAAMRSACSLPIIARPSAGLPHEGPQGQPVWPCGPDDFAQASLDLLRAGATLIGSCCGTAPVHTGAIAAVVGGVSLA